LRRDPATPYFAAIATLLAMGTLLPVLTGSSWAWSALLVVILITGSGMALRAATRSPVSVVVGQVVVGILAVTVLYAHDQSVLGFLPGPDALRTMGHLVLEGRDATRQFATPAPPVPGITFLLTCGVTAAAIAVDALAVTWGTSVAAGLPLLVLYCVPAAVLPHGASAVSFAMVAGGWLLLLGHDGRLRVNGWGRVLRKGGENGKRRFGEDDLEMMGASARRLGVLAVAAAIAVPLLLPSLSNGLIDPSGTGAGNGNGQGGLGASSIDPNLTLKQNLTARSTASVLTYTTPQSSPPTLRLVTDDLFDGSSWKSSDGHQQQPDRALGGDNLPAPVGLGDGVTATPYTMKVKVSTLRQGFLPVPYPATQIDVGGKWDYSPQDLDVISRGGDTKGLSYSVSYLDVQPTVAQLESAPAPDFGIAAQETRVPDFLSPSILKLAKQITARASTEYDKAAALQDYFRNTGGFTYDTTVDTRSGTDAVSAFLASKHGYCVQFSSAMAVMARLLGIPARIGVGFLPGSKQSNGSWSVSLNDAHAWPELYFEGVGWVRFEPTPAVRTGNPPSYTQPAATTTPVTGATGTATAPNPHDSVNPGLLGKTSPANSGKTSISSAATRATHLPVKVWAVILLALLAALATPVAALVTRWRRRRRAGDAVSRAEMAWSELTDRVGDLGVDLPAGSTPRQTQQWLSKDASLGGAAADALARLVHDIEQARYAAHPATRAADDPAPADDVTTVVRAVRAVAARSQRLRARVLPRSGTDQLVGLSSRASERIAGIDTRIARTGRSVTRGPKARSGPGRRRRIFGGRAH
jgi:transglutaminase-like putative cysteine protease